VLAEAAAVEGLPVASVQLLAEGLRRSGAGAEAEAVLRRGQRRHPSDPWLNYALGHLLHQRAAPDLAEAVRYYEAARATRPEIGHDLAHALESLKRPEDAAALLAELCRLRPANRRHHYCLGNALGAKGQLDEAIREYRTVIDLDPKYASAHYDLGIALTDKGQRDEAIREYCTALLYQPDSADAHCNLGHLLRDLLRDLGRFEEAVAELRRGHALGSRRPGWNYPSEQWVQQAERLAALDARLAAILKGEDRPTDAAEGLTVAWLCQQSYRQLYAASARFYADTFTAQPRLADDPRSGHRYNAACAAALTGCGQGKDATLLDDKEGVRLRRQALAWLRAELDAWAKFLDSATPEQRVQTVGTLKHWQEDTDLAGVRDKEALEKLPEGEREAWRTLWAEVEALRQNAAEKEPR
jgi:serine/threonine-protein kinase